MGKATVDNILRQIASLDEQDRALLDQRLAERAEAQWRSESTAAREEALKRGIGQAEIDRAIQRMRYGA